MQQPSLALKAVRAAEAGSDIGGDTIMVPADVTSSNAGPVEVERLGEVGELAAEAQDLSFRGSDGGENSSSQPIGAMLLRCSSARAYAVVLETAPLQRFLVLRTNASSKIVFYYRFMHNSASTTTLVRTTSRITVHFLSRKWPPEVPYPQKFPLRGLFVGCALSGARKIYNDPGGPRRKRRKFAQK